MNAMKKEIPNFEPFNDFWYQSCFTKSLLTVLKNYKVDIYKYILCSFYFYTMPRIDEPFLFNMQEIRTKDDDELLRDFGVEWHAMETGDSIQSKIIEDINDGSPIILYIDCFYEKMRRDTYGKKHLTHTITIYGYDLERRIFNIIEHDYLESEIYKKREISFEELEECHRGYKENIENGYTYFWFNQLESAQEYTQYQEKLYLEGFITHMETYQESLKCLSPLKHFLQDCSGNGTILSFYNQPLIRSLSEISGTKNAIAHVYEKAFGKEHQLSILARRISDRWYKLKLLSFKSNIVEDERKSIVFQNVPVYIDEIISLEHELVEYIRRL